MKRLAPLFLAVFVLVGTSTAISVNADWIEVPISHAFPDFPFLTGNSSEVFVKGISPNFNSVNSFILIPYTTKNGYPYYQAYIPASATVHVTQGSTGILYFEGDAYQASFLIDFTNNANLATAAYAPGTSRKQVSVTPNLTVGSTIYYMPGTNNIFTFGPDIDPDRDPDVPDNLWDWMWSTDDSWGDFFKVRLPQLWNILFPKDETDKEPTYTVVTPTPQPVEVYNPDGDLIFTIPVLPGGDGGGGFSLPDITINFPATEDEPSFDLPLDIDQQVKLTVGSAQTLARENETQGALTSLVGGFPLDFVKFIMSVYLCKLINGKTILFDEIISFSMDRK